MTCRFIRCLAYCLTLAVLLTFLLSLQPHSHAQETAAQNAVQVSENNAGALETEQVESVTRAGSARSQPLLDISRFLPGWMTINIFGTTTIGQLISVFLFILAGLVLKRISDFAIDKKVLPLLRKTKVDFDYLIVSAASKPVGYLLFAAGLAGACAVLPLPDKIARFAFTSLKILVSADVVWFLFRLVDVVAEYLARLTRRTDSNLDDQLVPLLSKALKVTVVLVGTVTAMQIIGMDVTGLVAGLCIGGLAVALGLQDTLANFFGSVFIFVDRPFVVGDLIKIGDVEGTVADVGFRSTRILTFPKTIVTIPNKTVANATIDNLSKRPKRRVMESIGLTYETTAEQMEEAVSTIRNIIETDDGVDPEYIVVRFREFADSSLNILVYYFTKSTDFADHLETKERVNLAIMRAIDRMGLSIAFPTRTVYFEGQIAQDMAATRNIPPTDNRTREPAIDSA